MCIQCSLLEVGTTLRIKYRMLPGNVLTLHKVGSLNLNVKRSLITGFTVCTKSLIKLRLNMLLALNFFSLRILGLFANFLHTKLPA